MNGYYRGYRIKNNEMGRLCGTYGERRGAWSVLMGKREGQRPLGRPTRKRDDNIKKYLKEIRSDDVNWIDLAQVRN
jgi:hypothetical protein